MFWLLSGSVACSNVFLCNILTLSTFPLSSLSRQQTPLSRFALLLYSFLWVWVLPFALARLAWRARRQGGYVRHVRERFGSYKIRAPGELIWIHAVSVGETRAAEPLVRTLLERYPDCSVLVTHMTPTGRETSKALFGDDSRVLRVYLPYDLPWFVSRFLRHFRPRFGVIMETELWPNLLFACQKQSIPVLLANGRLSERSARRYAHLPTLTGLMLGALTAIGAQSAADAARFTTLGGLRVSITGNIKFDSEPPVEALALGERFRARFGKRPVILAASTREGEEALILDAFVRLLQDKAVPPVLLVLAPRHPQRFDEVELLVRATYGLGLLRRSTDTELAGDDPVKVMGEGVKVWLGDAMGEMYACYSAADVALIGGSWLPYGGQNAIEACAVGTPVLLGPHTFNFKYVCDEAIQSGAALRFDTAEAALRGAIALLADTEARARMSTAGREFAAVNRGATERTLALLDDITVRD